MSDETLQAARGVPNACGILPHIVTGGQPDQAQLEAMKQAGVEVVLDIRDPMESRPIDEGELVRQLGMDYVNIPVTAGRTDDPTLERILEVLRTNHDRQIFFHCSSGNRVGGALIAHFMLDLEMDEEEAVENAMRVGLRSPEMLEWGRDYAARHAPDEEPGAGSGEL